MSAPDAGAIRAAAGGARFPSEIRLLPSTGSTNDALRAWLDEAQGGPGGLPEGCAVVADRQTAGRGRRGNAWHSPAGCGLYLSLLLRPCSPRAEWARWTLAGGLAAAEACAETGVDAALKWPNDLLARGRKLGGVLVETRGAAMIMGLGLNVRTPVDLPVELGERAIALDALGAPAGFGRARLAGRFLARIAELDAALHAGDWPAVRADWEARAPAVRGAAVTLRDGSGAGGPGGVRATTDGIDDDGALRVRLAAGTVRRVLQVDGVDWDAGAAGGMGE